MPVDLNIPRNEIWFIPDNFLEEAKLIMTYAIPPEQLPSEESNFMAHNDYGYGVHPKMDTSELVQPSVSEQGKVLNDLQERTGVAVSEFQTAALDMHKSQMRYNEVHSALADAKERYQRTFFAMNERIGELNEWLAQQVGESDNKKEGPRG